VNRHIILLGLGANPSSDAIQQRKDLIERCPNLEILKDETRELGYMMDISLPSTVSHLFLHLKAGKASAKPIKAPGISDLVITADLTLRESPHNTEASEYSSKVLTLCRNIVRLDSLSLQLPGLQVHPLYRMPIGSKVEDMLPPTLKSISELQIQLPFCSLEPDNPRQTHAVSRCVRQFRSTQLIGSVYSVFGDREVTSDGS